MFSVKKNSQFDERSIHWTWSMTDIFVSSKNANDIMLWKFMISMDIDQISVHVDK